MYGFSVFVNEELTQETLAYMEAMAKSGFRGIFTSIHIPEDDDSKYLNGLQKLGTFARENEMELVVDISGTALERLGYSLGNVKPLVEMGLTGIRIDYGISMETVADLSHQMNVALNASTISARDLDELKSYGADFSRMEAWHNYYPRPETGLDEIPFQKQNQVLKAAGFQVMAFVPSDEKKRGPLHMGLPTLEKHRDMNPLGAALELVKACDVDKVYIGDPEISERLREQFHLYMEENTILFHATSLLSEWDQHADRVAGRHRNRMDSARDVVRSEESRLQAKGPIEQGLTMKRSIGSITMDNDGYGRYAGEIQITKRSLPEDERVNVIGRIDEQELSLLEFCGPGQLFEIRWEERE